jgi:hypothetical protein
MLAPTDASARTREGDRFGIRGGIWPQGEVVGTLDRRPIYPGGDSLDILIDEEAMVLPFLEIYGLFHLGGRWWAEGSAGWSGRTDVQIGGFSANDSVLLGSGRVDFFPLFAGLRVVQPIGAEGRPHNVFARAGGSLVFASESADLVQDSVLKYNLYNPGTEGAFGFLVGVGGEYYINRTFGLLADVQYRYTNFNYLIRGRGVDFDVSAFWLAVGLTLKTR